MVYLALLYLCKHKNYLQVHLVFFKFVINFEPTIKIINNFVNKQKSYPSNYEKETVNI